MGKRKSGQARKGFSLLEAMVAMTVFSLVITAGGGIFVSLQAAWRRQKGGIKVIENSAWAMEFMANELRGRGNILIWDAGGALSSQLPADVVDVVWYWRGEGGAFGNSDVIYRGSGLTKANANTNRQELANLIVDNTSGNDIFNILDGLLTIELTLRPQPAQAENLYNRDYTLRTQLRARN
ncbi:MAG: hypothetical protein A3J51_03655 [Omnitrophica WOR_2 bacterium RIFCSPHIGHO2_02_FULL_45_21]|nr:MAG: hypothetical protein A3J51_03655 [Omnitrophica WOR_2 bacterium RIFCSPHIGHO2_02_FULL_45_21]